MQEKATPDVLDALAERIWDEDPDTRAEAVVGLARNKDQRAVEPLIKFLDELQADDEWSYIEGLLYEAARELGDTRLCPALLKLKSMMTNTEELDETLERCGCETK
jgi:HEAT repeat protein